MNEVQAYLNFFKRNALVIFAPVVLFSLISLYFYASEPNQYKISQEFRQREEIFAENPLNQEAVLSLRDQNFEEELKTASNMIYSEGDDKVIVDVISSNRDEAYSLLVKNSNYLESNYRQLKPLKIDLTILPINFLKYLLGGFLSGAVTGLFLSLFRGVFNKR